MKDMETNDKMNTMNSGDSKMNTSSNGGSRMNTMSSCDSKKMMNDRKSAVLKVNAAGAWKNLKNAYERRKNAWEWQKNTWKRLLSAVLAAAIIVPSLFLFLPMEASAVENTNSRIVSGNGTDNGANGGAGADLAGQPAKNGVTRDVTNGATNGSGGGTANGAANDATNGAANGVENVLTNGTANGVTGRLRMKNGQDDATEALKRQIEDLKKIISLNVKEAEGIPIILYHHVINRRDMTAADGNNDFILSTELFEEHMKYLHDNNYYTASIEELEQYISGELTLPEKTVVITFDDGYKSNIRFCYPILKKLNFKASIFLTTSLIGKKGGNIIERANWNDLNRASDVFSYHCHSYDMHKTGTDGRAMYLSLSQVEIRKDLRQSKELINSSYHAYPYGQWNQVVISALKRLGYKMAFTTETGYVRKNSNVYELPRFTITPRITTDALAGIIAGARIAS
jgi:peptidoglycan/xylan/chitin deacetylase (PgdA/CDA1 family)